MKAGAGRDLGRDPGSALREEEPMGVPDKADIARLDGRLGALDQRLGAVEQRLGAIEARLSLLVTSAELERTTRQLKERIDAPNWKSIVIETVSVAALTWFVLRVLWPPE